MLLITAMQWNNMCSTTTSRCKTTGIATYLFIYM